MNVRLMYKELLLTSLILNLFDAFLTGVMIFSILYFLIYFYRLNFVIAIVVAAVLFIRSLVMKIRQNKILFLENKYPYLKERLRTSFDHQEKQNSVVNELHSEILTIINKIDVNTFLSARRLFIKVTVICFMLFSSLYLSAHGFDILDVQKAVTGTGVYKAFTSLTGSIFDDKREEVKDRPTLDDPRLAALGNKDLNISIDAYNTELDINQINSPEKNDYGGNYPKDIQGAAQQAYEEKIPEEYKDAIKEYFRKINK